MRKTNELIISMSCNKGFHTNECESQGNYAALRQKHNFQKQIMHT